MSDSFYWYDLETFGTDPKTSRIAQFAGIRTDLSLNIIGEPQVWYNKPSDDFIPEPEAVLITAITPQLAAQKGIAERQFISKIATEFNRPRTCVVGYNNLRFDDEFIRYALYRNFHDPYQREYANGNSRWDMIDLTRAARALRPDGINWPLDSAGEISNKLELLSAANNIEHTKAHDALADVEATIGIARLIKNAQPKMWQYFFKLRSKQQLAKMLDVEKMQPLVHVSGMFANRRHNIALVAPIAYHPSNKNAVVVYDLLDSPKSWLHLSDDALAERIFSRSELLLQMGEDYRRIGIKNVHLNKCPIIAPLKVLDEKRAQDLGIDIKQQLAHLAELKTVPNLSQRIAKVFHNQSFLPLTDADQMLYGGGFASAQDKALMRKIVAANKTDLIGLNPKFSQEHYRELFFRYLARNAYAKLEHKDKKRYQRHRLGQIIDGNNGYLNVAQFKNKIGQLVPSLTRQQIELLEQTTAYVDLIATKQL